MSAIIYMAFWAYFRYLNKRRDEGKEDHTVEGMTEEDIQELGEHNPRFRYTY
jgi:MFS transporter, ACS family, DAL5 transporter family protein